MSVTRTVCRCTGPNRLCSTGIRTKVENDGVMLASRLGLMVPASGTVSPFQPVGKFEKAVVSGVLSTAEKGVYEGHRLKIMYVRRTIPSMLLDAGIIVCRIIDCTRPSANKEERIGRAGFNHWRNHEWGVANRWYGDTLLLSWEPLG